MDDLDRSAGSESRRRRRMGIALNETQCLLQLPPRVLHLHVSLSVLGSSCHNAARMMRMESDAVPSVLEFQRLAKELGRVRGLLCKHVRIERVRQQQASAAFEQQRLARKAKCARSA